MGSYRTYHFRVREEAMTMPILNILDKLLGQLEPSYLDGGGRIKKRD